MAERPIFVPRSRGISFVEVVSVSFKWNPGFAAVQKKKNITALHDAGARAGYTPLLETSSKSECKLGQRLSAFSLVVCSNDHGEMPLESAFQGSKVFENGGPYTDLYRCTAREAKKDPRIRSSGRVVGFRFDGTQFPIEPKTVFYDWLYIATLFPHREFLSRLRDYAGFTDIEFNPQRSVNCQARSCATMAAMIERGVLEEAISSPTKFIQTMREHTTTGNGQEREQGRMF